jgi:hypothetical protein
MCIPMCSMWFKSKFNMNLNHIGHIELVAGNYRDGLLRSCNNPTP